MRLAAGLNVTIVLAALIDKSPATTLPLASTITKKLPLVTVDNANGLLNVQTIDALTGTAVALLAGAADAVSAGTVPVAEP
ncbi:hypothetical protein D3C75_987590 [compost metagenome]